MKFNSIEFLVFLAVVFFLFWRLNKSLKLNNILLLIASYVFYGWWDYRFLFLMFFSSVVDFTVGFYLPRTSKRKLLVGISLVINLGLLAFFKYYNFFVASFADLVTAFGLEANYQVLNIILPVGISFYTFQTLSYTLDIYKGKIKPTGNFIAFLNYVSFFPQLVAGPIERAAVFFPQFMEKRVFVYQNAVVGMRLILYGLFKKMVIADNIGQNIDPIYADPSSQSSLMLMLSAPLFLIQLYADFSAYTDIARGVAKTLGFELMRNFRTPLFSKSIPEFWTRWHISLTTWFRDYLFIWLASIYRNSTLWRIVATVILFFVIGLWHGANYTFVLFGIINGLLYIPRILARNSKGLRNFLQIWNGHIVLSNFAILFTFGLLSLLSILFRSDDIQKAGFFFNTMIEFNSKPPSVPIFELIAVPIAFLVFEWITQAKSHPFDLEGYPSWLRRTLYVLLILSILLFGYFGKDPFYYFQF